MIKLIKSLLVVLLTMPGLIHAQENIDVDSLNYNSQDKQNAEAVVYRLYPTKNMWTFIKLNTRNGKMYQVQFNMDNDNRFETYLNLVALVEEDKEANGRFTLYPTQNTWTFMLLDQIDGNMWQVQWSQDPDKRIVLPIY